MSQTNIVTGTMEIPRGGRSEVFWLEVGDRHVHRSYAVAEGVRLVVGTNDACDVVLRDRTVSKRHCEVGCVDGLVWVRDLGSKNGVYAGGARVAHAQLSPGSSFAVGRVPMCIRVHSAVDMDAKPLPGVIGTSAPMIGVAALARSLAKLSVPILIRGATGTGKDVVARAIHALSARATGPFVPRNMGAIPTALAAAELFGYERGAFTGANQARKGAFVAAHGGTLFLDEIAEASGDVQVHLLRALEQREVQPLGSDRRIAVDVRVIAATWAPLERTVTDRGFRQDLFHRLAVGTIFLPTLADRKADIGALVQHILNNHRDEVGDKKIAPAALGRLMTHSWPGNVRELSNVVLRAAVLANQQWIQARDVDAALGHQPTATGRMSQAAARALVESCDGKVMVAAQRCGVPRSTFRGWLEGRGKKSG